MIRSAPSPALTSFLTALDRVEAILDEERDALTSLSGGALKALSDQKARSLLEISRAARGLQEADRPAVQVQARLERLRGKLDQNRTALLRHLDAAREIAALVSRAIQEAESDGTYGAGLARRAGP
jgi:chromosome segregation ATPase